MAVASVTHTFAPNTLIESSEANTNFNDLVTFANTQTIHKDASVAFTGVPSGPGTDASSDNQFVRKAMLEGRSAFAKLRVDNVGLAGTGTAITVGSWTQDIMQPAAYFSVVADELQVNIAGWYMITATFRLNPSAFGNYMGMALYKDAAVAATDSCLNNDAFSAYPTVKVSEAFSCAASSKFHVDIAQNSGAGKQAYVRLQAEYIRPL